ncbi:hypothetical protein HMPREF1150_0150 [Streptococcus sp. AS14]|uniref:Uncharacterized protein n=1 Tax=Streptococcus sanguinis SK1056 TaxID=888820 RepID=F3UDE5_STRSA|nr:hypothetical protein HMPREF9393_1552 [Streptococcus sanguinis SK1056]EJO18459.1 hypothetical protein HMPREF1150_0150 [Streptococcus sp. AS14]
MYFTRRELSCLLIFLPFIQENPIHLSKRDSDNLEFFRKSC